MKNSLLPQRQLNLKMPSRQWWLPWGGLGYPGQRPLDQTILPSLVWLITLAVTLLYNRAITGATSFTDHSSLGPKMTTYSLSQTLLEQQQCVRHQDVVTYKDNHFICFYSLSCPPPTMQVARLTPERGIDFSESHSSRVS